MIGEDNALSEQGASVPLVGTSVDAGRDTYNPFGRNEVGVMGLSLWSSEDNLSQRAIDVLPYALAHLQAQGRTPTEGATQYRVPTGSKPSKSGEISETASETEAGHRGTPGVEGLICAYPWPQGCNYWTGVARCESTLGEDPDAYADWNPYVGLFQVDVAHGYGREWLKVDANNVLAAWEISHEGTRTSPWPYCQWQ